MAENRTTKFTDLAQEIKQFPGPYVGYVKNPTDVNRMGRLFVHIPELHGNVNTVLRSQDKLLWQTLAMIPENLPTPKNHMDFGWYHQT